MGVKNKLLLLIVVLALAAGPALAGDPHTSYGIVEGAEASNSCEWIFYVVSRPGEMLSSNLANVTTTYYWQAIVGNLATPWNVGEDSMVIVKKENDTGNIGHTAFYAVMNEDFSNEMPQSYNNCTLRQVPIPTALVVGSGVDLSWGAAQTDVSQTPQGNNVIGYNVYRSEDGISHVKINTSLVTGTTFTDNKYNSEPDPTYEMNYYYAIEPVFRGEVALGVTSANSNQVQFPEQSLEGDVVLNLTYDSQTGNIYWISMPYIHSFPKASDIITKINTDHGLPTDSGDKITQIGRWDHATQQYETFDYLGMIGWSGADFSLVAEEAIFINIAANVSATLPGSHDPNFVFNLIHNVNLGNIVWISLPKTSTYADAVSIIADININASKASDSGDIISQIGHWDAANQAYETYDHLGMIGWSGQNFSFTAGDGYFINLIDDINNWGPSVN